jgi:transglutaminase-like putative cysteine protease
MPALASRRWDLVAVLLLLAALVTAASRLTTTRWDEHLNLILALTFVGGLAGLALGHSTFSPVQAVALAFGYGLFVIFWQLGLTLGSGILWSDRLGILSDRLVLSITQILERRPVMDPLFFLFWMSCLFWAVSTHAGYTLTRHEHPWRATLPTGLAMLVIHTYDPLAFRRIWFLAVYLFFVLLLVVRLTYLHDRDHWRQSRIPLPFIGSGLTVVHLLIIASLVLVAWSVPALAAISPSVEQAWQRVTRPWIAVRDRMGDAFASLRSADIPIGYDYYSKHLSLGSGHEFADTLILTVEVPPNLDTNMRYYWRARVYDRYADNEWRSTFALTETVTSSYWDLTFPDLAGRRTAVFTFTPGIPIATLFAAPQPLWVSRPAQADLTYNLDGTADLAALHATPPLPPGETYQAQSSLSDVTIAQLRAAGDNYPVWITTHYLQLPPTITSRTRALARQITLDLDNPYDIAAAITSYLRANILYSDTIPDPPADQEILDWFLFDVRRGYCNYYASADVILLRSLGVPARLAVGLGEGERQEESNTYLVRQSDAHAWPEVYFPGLGWIEFEPTVSYPPIDRPLGENQPLMPPVGDPERHRQDLEEFSESDELALLDESLPAPALGFRSRPRETGIAWILSLVLSLVLIAFSLATRHQPGMPSLPILLQGGLCRLGFRPPIALRRWASYATQSPLVRAYLELNRALIRLGVPPSPADTPAERVVALTRLLPAAADSARRLLSEYHATVYSAHPGDLYVAQQAARTIRNLSWQASIRRRIFRPHELARSASPVPEWENSPN